MKQDSATRHYARRSVDEARLQIGQLSIAQLDLEEIFRRICRISADTLQVERVGVWLFVHGGVELRCVVLYERSRQEFSAGTTLQVADFPAYFESLTQRKTIPAASAAHDPRTSELFDTYLAPLGIEAMLDAPILLEGEPIGVVCHEHVGEPREWTTEERDFAGSVADAVALQIKGAELEQAHRLRQLGAAHLAAFRQRDSNAQLAAGVAHDFRNLLTVVIGGAQEIRREAAAQPAVVELADAVLDAARRGAAIASQLMELARNQAGHPRVLDVTEALDRLQPLLQHAAGDRHFIELASAGHPGRVFMDATQLERILLNLVLNARDAMPDGGSIRIRLAAERSADPAHERRDVVIEVRDTGHGVDPAVLPRIFDPFFTTKARQNGSGLGLAVVQHIVDLAGGRIEVDSAPGAGATFRVCLPRVAG